MSNFSETVVGEDELYSLTYLICYLREIADSETWGGLHELSKELCAAEDGRVPFNIDEVRAQLNGCTNSVEHLQRLEVERRLPLGKRVTSEAFRVEWRKVYRQAREVANWTPLKHARTVAALEPTLNKSPRDTPKPELQRLNLAISGLGEVVGIDRRQMRLPHLRGETTKQDNSYVRVHLAIGDAIKRKPRRTAGGATQPSHDEASLGGAAFAHSAATQMSKRRANIYCLL